MMNTNNEIYTAIQEIDKKYQDKGTEWQEEIILTMKRQWINKKKIALFVYGSSDMEYLI